VSGGLKVGFGRFGRFRERGPARTYVIENMTYGIFK